MAATTKSLISFTNAQFLKQPRSLLHPETSLSLFGSPSLSLNSNCRSSFLLYNSLNGADCAAQDTSIGKKMDIPIQKKFPSFTTLMDTNEIRNILPRRFASSALWKSTYNFGQAYNASKGGSSIDIWGLKWRNEFHSQSFQKSLWFSSPSTRYAGRSYSLFNIQRCYSNASRERKSQHMLLYLVALVFAMVGSSYAAVPLYRRFCQATGYGGTVQRRESVEEKIARHTKDGTVTTSAV